MKRRLLFSALLVALLALVALPVTALAEGMSYYGPNASPDDLEAPLGATSEEPPEGVTNITNIMMASINTNITLNQVISFNGKIDPSTPNSSHVRLFGEYWEHGGGQGVVAASDNWLFEFNWYSEVIASNSNALNWVGAFVCDEGYYIPNNVTMTYLGKTYKGTIMMREDAHPSGSIAIVEFSLSVKASSPVPLYRMYNTKTSEHLWTRSKAEYDSCGSGSYADWKAEGVAWYAPRGGKPVFRLYNLKSGDHHYTTSLAERDKLLASGQWRDEGIAFYSATKKDTNTITIYRVYNGRLKRGQHHYTKSAAERDSLVKNSGWKDEGVGFYGYKTSSPAAAKPINADWD